VENIHFRWTLHRKDVLVVHSCKYNLYFFYNTQNLLLILYFEIPSNKYIVIIIIIIYVLDSAGSLWTDNC